MTKIPIAVSTIVAPDAMSKINETNNPRNALAIPNTGERRIVCLNDLLTWRLVRAGRTSRAEISKTPTIGIAAITTTPARAATR